MELIASEIEIKKNPSFEKKQSRQILIVTGLSGSGKSTVLRALEDLGFYCVDNLPIPLLSTFLDFVIQSQTNVLKIALGIDARGRGFLKDFMNEIDKIKQRENESSLVKVIFLNSSNNTIVKRFQETRRKHPLSHSRSLIDAIKREREILQPIEELSDAIHHTDRSNIHELRRWARNTFADGYTQEVIANLVSFGFKYGVPAESNLVYDLRFLPNPYFVAELRTLDGRSEQVKNYLFCKEDVNSYWIKLEDFLKYVLQKYYEEGRFFVNIAIGCTGGKHRSVAFVEKLGKQQWKNIKFLIYHRDLGKE